MNNQKIQTETIFVLNENLIEFFNKTKKILKNLNRKFIKKCNDDCNFLYEGVYDKMAHVYYHYNVLKRITCISDISKKYTKCI